MNLQELLYAADFEVFSYSGRGMYGKSCVAIRCSSVASGLVQIFEAILSNYDNDEDRWEALEVVQRLSSDKLGYDTVLYWPNVEFDREDYVDQLRKLGWYVEDSYAPGMVKLVGPKHPKGIQVKSGQEWLIALIVEADLMEEHQKLFDKYLKERKNTTVEDWADFVYQEITVPLADEAKLMLD